MTDKCMFRARSAGVEAGISVHSCHAVCVVATCCDMMHSALQRGSPDHTRVRASFYGIARGVVLSMWPSGASMITVCQLQPQNVRHVSTSLVVHTESAVGESCSGRRR